MTDHPMIFSAPMVRALLAGTKTMTRRLLRPQPPEGARYTGVHFASYEPNSWFFNSPRGPFKVRERYAVGDRIWVREAWRTLRVLDNIKPRQLSAERTPIAYGGDTDDIGHLVINGRYRHARFMPRWANRITLTITDVRVQRVQEISEEDAAAEGCRPFFDYDNPVFEPTPDGHDDIEMAPLRSAVDAYATLWDSLNAKRAPWESNPWVTALTFSVRNGNIDE